MSLNTMSDVERTALTSSNDYSKYGIRDAPKTTVTTPLGRTKTVAGLFTTEWIFLTVSLVNILTAVGLTTYRLVTVIDDDPESADFTFTILLLINAGFCLFYTLHGVLRERVYELYSLMVALIVVGVYCLMEYTLLNPEGRSTVKLIRLVMICVMAPPNIVLAYVVSRNFGFLEFRIVGASTFLQKLYRQAALFSCLLKFDLQCAVQIVILAMKDGTRMGVTEAVSLAVGLPFSLAWAAMGWVALRRELPRCMVAFAVLGLAKPAYYMYKITMEYINLRDDTVDTNNTIVYTLIAAVALGLLVWLLMMVELTYVMRNFGLGLKERTQQISREGAGLLEATREGWNTR